MKFWALFFSVFISFGLSSQEFFLFTGRVVAFTKIPLEKITVAARKSNAKVKTDKQGKFEIKIIKKDVLTFSADGFESVRYRVKNAELNPDINMKFINTPENREIAVGMGYLSEDMLATGVQQINTEALRTGEYTNIYDLIRAKVPGVQLIQENGITKFKIRGNTSVYASEGAMFIVNGMQVNDISFLSPFDISNVTLLKDAAAAEYGVRGANGVIIIETARAKDPRTGYKSKN